jgi:hypothetical protein
MSCRYNNHILSLSPFPHKHYLAKLKMSFKSTPLFGGAITVDLPSNFDDTR